MAHNEPSDIPSHHRSFREPKTVDCSPVQDPFPIGHGPSAHCRYSEIINWGKMPQLIISLFKCCITSMCNTYFYVHIVQPKQSMPVKISRSQQLRIHDGKYQVRHYYAPDIRGFLSISPPTHNIHPQMAP